MASVSRAWWSRVRRGCRLVIACLSAACAGAGPQQPALPWSVQELTQARESLLQDAPSPEQAERIQLGRMLFYDPLLSRDRQTACATCHSEVWGMSDALARSVGHGAGLLAGPGRHGGGVSPRNAPGLWNLTFRESLFWDGRARTLEEQALLPLRDPVELDRDPDEVVRDLSQLQGYRTQFALAFPDAPLPKVQGLASAIASFERSLVSLQSLYDAYAAGDEYALDDTQVMGMFRLQEHGCTDCHVPPLFEKEAYFDRGIGDGSDDGRSAHTGFAADRGAFRVPTLRNTAFTGPHFHDGSVATLEEAVAHELSRSAPSHSDADRAAIVAFIRDALKDESREPDRPRQVPSGLAVPLDGTQLDR